MYPAGKPSCKIKVCNKDARANGWCQVHYMRNWHHGSPLAKVARIHGTVAERLAFMTKASRNGCVEWQGALDKRGYGRISDENGWSDMAHRVAYRLKYGEMPKGKVIHHKCFNTKCVNPEHLEVTTHFENIIIKGKTNAAFLNAQKTHCIHGHNLNNAYIQKTKYGYQRICKECHKRRIAKYKAKKELQICSTK